MPSKKTLSPSDITAIFDTREQLPLDLGEIPSIRGTLATGDYSVVGLEHVIAVERKSLDDLLGCVGNDRERFDRECQRLLGYPTRAIVVEASWSNLESGLGLDGKPWRSQVTPAAALGSVLGWACRGIPIFMIGDHERAGKYVSRLLFLAARRRWRELQTFCDNLRLAEPSAS